MKNRIIKVIIGAVLSVSLILILSPQWSAVAKERYEDLQLFAKVLNLVQQYYVEETNTTDLIYGGIKGMLRELDPHTNFLPPKIFKEFESETQGKFGGLGIEITVQNGVLTVISPIEDTPAWKAGVKAGDKIVEIDGESTKGLSLAEAAQKMKGKMGTKVRLGIFREGLEKPIQIVVERGVVKIKSVKYIDLGDGYAYLRLTSFIENSAKDVELHLKNHLKKSKVIKGVIFDVRRNPGGLLDQAVRISDMFLNEGVIVTTVSRNKKEREVLHAKRSGTLDDFPMIILIDEYSASASEILAGALQDNRRALVMGQRSFGKGSVQSVVPLGDGSGLKLTVARYYTPSGRSIQAEGIHPDVVVEQLDSKALQDAKRQQMAKREKDIQGHLRGEGEEGGEEPQSGAGQPTNGSAQRAFWWTGGGDKPKELSLKEKLLAEDYQAQQAYNYLMAWTTMSKLKETQKAESKSAQP